MYNNYKIIINHSCLKINVLIHKNLYSKCFEYGILLTKPTNIVNILSIFKLN